MKNLFAEESASFFEEEEDVFDFNYNFPKSIEDKIRENSNYFCSNQVFYLEEFGEFYEKTNRTILEGCQDVPIKYYLYFKISLKDLFKYGTKVRRMKNSFIKNYHNCIILMKERFTRYCGCEPTYMCYDFHDGGYIKMAWISENYIWTDPYTLDECIDYLDCKLNRCRIEGLIFDPKSSYAEREKKYNYNTYTFPTKINDFMKLGDSLQHLTYQLPFGIKVIHNLEEAEPTLVGTEGLSDEQLQYALKYVLSKDNFKYLHKKRIV